ADLAMSLFGAMFFVDPVAAFANIGASLRTNGRLVLMTWRDLRENDWLMSLRGALAQGRDLPYPPANAPTPFSLAEPERVRTVLGEAGFDDIELTPIDEPLDLGPDADAAFAFVRTLGIVQGLSHDLDAAQRDKALDEIRQLLIERETPDGVLLGAAAWTITAVRAR
ncbi:MAG: SAM-dependent methyltransferase, partial [Acidimicrobiales bacterium]